jgi:hypothetical protein
MAPTSPEGQGRGLSPMGGIPNIGSSRSPEAVDGHHLPGPADLQVIVLEGLAALHPLAQTSRRHRVAHPSPLDQGQGHMHPAGLAIGGVEAGGRKGAQEGPLRLKTLPWHLAGASMRAGVHPLVKPGPRPPV